jgi:anti-anti-sigma factor
MSAEEGRSHGLRWSVERQHGLTTVRLDGELDLSVSEDLTALLDPLLGTGSAVVLDLEGLEFMDSTGIRILGRAKQQADQAGGRFLLGRPSMAVRRVLQVAGLMSFFEYVEGAPPDDILCPTCDSWNPTRSSRCLHCGAAL